MKENQEQDELEGKWRKIYVLGRILVYFVFLVGVIYFLDLAFFPSRKYVFYFRTPLASKNTIIEPRNEAGELYRKGKIEDGKIIFETPISLLDGNFSKVQLKLFLEKDSAAFTKGNVQVKKSHRAFFYPLGDTLQEIPKQFKEKNASGSLFSYGNAVYVLDGNKIRAVADEVTFESLGWRWENVQVASSEDLEMYESGKIFTLADLHPDGTIFLDSDSGQYYLVRDKKRHPLIIEDDNNLSRLESFSIKVNGQSIERSANCDLNFHNSLFGRYLACTLAVESISEFIGSSFHFDISLDPGLKIKKAEVTFAKSRDITNLKLALSNIKKNVILNYYGRPR